MSSEHAVIAPSGIVRDVECPGGMQLRRTAIKPPQDASASEEGTLKHELAAKWLETDERPEGACDNVKLYVDYCIPLTGDHAIEKLVKVPSIHPTDCWGTPDFLAFNDDTLEVVDFKYGFKWVTRYDQLIVYAQGAIDTYNNVNPKRIRLTYVQPRSTHPDGPIRTLELTRDELAQRVNHIRIQIERGLSGNAPLVSGPHCYRCPAQYKCAANTEATYNAIDVVSTTDSIDDDVETLGGELAALERGEELLKERRISIEEILKFKISQGERSSKYEIGTSLGHYKWNCADHVLKLECELEGVKHTKEVIKSPNEMIAAGLSKTTKKRLTSRPAYLKLKRIRGF